MEIKLVPTCAGYCLALNGVAHNGKGLRANVEAMLNELGAVYEYDDVATSVKIISLEKDGVNCVGWWDCYIDYSDNRVFLLTSN
ncbi:hypothetical protein CPT_Margaery244 [Citrobacter phage Margaery]|uniref:Uncharacterized protein n=1 Tax=Citrobacter phage Margaery TaxID=1701810 RepID=A0A0M3ULB7_9CAUD|nr:hypothetical protein CPT_Margaery244 [Citrobacter phage Margaery]ALF01933.1 hypothetical protein CPT_Margaery244 [Citrobacter phage Margaery]